MERVNQIKFRGKSLLGLNPIITGSLVVDPYTEETFIAWKPEDDGFQLCPVDPETVGQFTGLHDKHGKEIWEGDILISKVDLKGGVSNIVEVFYNEGGFDYRWNEDGKVRKQWLKHYTFHSLEVIGNIHTNPELINQK